MDLCQNLQILILIQIIGLAVQFRYLEYFPFFFRWPKFRKCTVIYFISVPGPSYCFGKLYENCCMTFNKGAWLGKGTLCNNGTTVTSCDCVHLPQNNSFLFPVSTRTSPQFIFKITIFNRFLLIIMEKWILYRRCYKYYSDGNSDSCLQPPSLSELLQNVSDQKTKPKVNS